MRMIAYRTMPAWLVGSSIDLSCFGVTWCVLPSSNRTLSVYSVAAEPVLTTAPVQVEAHATPLQQPSAQHGAHKQRLGVSAAPLVGGTPTTVMKNAQMHIQGIQPAGRLQLIALCMAALEDLTSALSTQAVRCASGPKLSLLLNFPCVAITHATTGQGARLGVQGTLLQPFVTALRPPTK